MAAILKILFLSTFLVLLPNLLCHGQESLSADSLALGGLMIPVDEFNTSESHKIILDRMFSPNAQDESSAISSSDSLPINSLRQLLLRQSYTSCCLSWKNLTTNTEIVEELKRKFGKTRTLRASDLVQELKRSFLNVTYLSIDGQPGPNERVKYYQFYDELHYFMRLIKVSREYLESMGQVQSGQDVDFVRSFRRHLRSIEFRVTQDPVLSSFLDELLIYKTPINGTESMEANELDAGPFVNPRFEFYEDFIRYTKFGQLYAKNVSMIRESALVFSRIVDHLTSTDFPSNYTRPSKQYEMIRRMSRELYLIHSELVNNISIRVRTNRPDAIHIMSTLQQLARTRPYVKMLGDEFGGPEHQNYSSDVRKLTELLDQYLGNKLTHVSFYEQLADLPQDFIILGSSIARDYEGREISQYGRFQSDYLYPWPSEVYQPVVSHQASEKNSSSQPNRVDGRRSRLSLLTRLFY